MQRRLTRTSQPRTDEDGSRQRRCRFLLAKNWPTSKSSHNVRGDRHEYLLTVGLLRLLAARFIVTEAGEPRLMSLAFLLLLEAVASHHHVVVVHFG